jgi:hypothetical protein
VLLDHGQAAARVSIGKVMSPPQSAAAAGRTKKLCQTKPKNRLETTAGLSRPTNEAKKPLAPNGLRAKRCVASQFRRACREGMRARSPQRRQERF